MMEERGRVQRVYAVEGLGAAQFALTGVVDQVRIVERELSEGRQEPVVLATSDPANAYGAALDWPPSQWAGGSGAPHRPSRAAGCHIVQVAGHPVLYVERGGRSVLTFARPSSGPETDAGADLTAAVRALAEAARAGAVGALTISRVNGTPVMELGGSDEVKRALEEGGFALTPRGYRLPR